MNLASLHFTASARGADIGGPSHGAAFGPPREATAPSLPERLDPAPEGEGGLEMAGRSPMRPSSGTQHAEEDPYATPEHGPSPQPSHLSDSDQEMEEVSHWGTNTGASFLMPSLLGGLRSNGPSI